jgi:hypothetical protein
MQKMYMRSQTTVTDLLKQEKDDILHFSLQSTLPPGHTLALNTTLGTLSYLVCEGEIPRLLLQEQFTSTEISILMPLLDTFPYYCPYEVLYASFYNGNTTGKTVNRCRQHLQEAQEAGVWDQEIRPIRGALSRSRLKLRSWGIDIQPILVTGYMLIIGELLSPISNTNT